MTKKTIYVATAGRLGNQLFQLIGGYSIARKYDCDFKIIYKYDCSKFDDNQQYPVLINKFKQMCGDDVFVDEYPEDAFILKNDDTFEVIKDEVFSDIINTHDDIVIEHLLQHESYINEKLACQIMWPEQKTIEYISKKYGDLTNTVAISVRRGDYLNCMNVFMIPKWEWYISTYYEYFNGKNILISSDDIDWCRENLKFDKRIKVDYCTENAEISLIVISLCRGGFIGSNSTFSWWGAYLGEDKTHDIIFPNIWFNPMFCKNNIICKSWKTASIDYLYEGYMNIDIYTLCYNEMNILPYVVDYWKRIARHVYVFDNGSTDGSKEYLSSFPWVSIVEFNSENTFNDLLHMRLKNECWKKNDADFVIVCDIDECVFDEQIFGKLYYMKQHKQTISHTLFLETISETIQPYQSDKLYHEYDGVNVITDKNKIKFDDKCLIFDPSEITDINYLPGAHACEPEGNVKYYDLQHTIPFKTIHIKNLSLQYKLDRINLYKNRLSDDNLKHNMGYQYLWDEHKLIEDFNEDLSNSQPYKNVFKN